MQFQGENLHIKINKSRWDKILSISLFVIGLIWFFVDKFVSIIQDAELRYIVQMISVFSGFYTVLSFMWDKKVEILRVKLSSTIAEYNDQLHENHEELRNSIQSSLFERGLIESRILSEYETDIRHYLDCPIGSDSRALIVVVTNSAEVEQEQFAQAIKKNILDNHQYIYITPFDNMEFTKGLEAKLFEGEESNHLLAAAFIKNVAHFQDKAIFDLLPGYSDMVVYIKKELSRRTHYSPISHGYYCFQNGGKTSQIANGDSTEFYFYTRMDDYQADEIAKLAQERIEWDTSKSWVSNSLEPKDSKLGGKGLFTKTKIEKGQLLIRKGGWFVKKTDLDPALRKSNNYIQIDDQYVLSAQKAHEDMLYGISIRINHSCKNANCGMRNEIEIVATEEINEGMEILIDYAYWDLEYTPFECKCDCSDNCARKQGGKIDIAKLVDNKNSIAPYLRDQLQLTFSAKS